MTPLCACGKPVILRKKGTPVRPDRCADCGRQASRDGLTTLFKARPGSYRYPKTTGEVSQ